MKTLLGNSWQRIQPSRVTTPCAGRHLVFEGGQQLFQVVEFARVQQQIGFKLVRTDGGVLLAQLVQLKVRHHFHVFLDQSGVRIKVSWLLWEERVG